MAGFPAETVTLLGLPAIVKLGAKTTWLKTEETLAENLESPAYRAVIGCVPTASAEVVNVATALLFSVPAPSAAVPSRKVTVPVGVLGALELIVAVKVTAVPLDTETAELSKAVVVGAKVMLSETTGEVLLAKVALPAYLQAIQ
jgi:hypothetical protein